MEKFGISGGSFKSLVIDLKVEEIKKNIEDLVDKEMV